MKPLSYGFAYYLRGLYNSKMTLCLSNSFIYIYGHSMQNDWSPARQSLDLKDIQTLVSDIVKNDHHWTIFVFKIYKCKVYHSWNSYNGEKYIFCL